MNEIPLEGCTPLPLVGYLKALGVLRLLSARAPKLRALWRDDHFVLLTDLDRHGIMHFFLEDYAPTPVVAPWNGGSGFFQKDKKDAIDAIRGGRAERLASYRASLVAADEALAGFDRSGSPKGEEKHRLLLRVRALLPDDALAWLDAAVVLAGDNAKYPPLLGTGGNDGRLDFTNNFMQRLVNVIDPESGTSTDEAKGWLETALFGAATAGLHKGAIGQFSPGQAGGPNSSVGFGEKGRVNPWDFILMIEGALVFTSAAVRRHASEGEGASSYPFTVRTTSAGVGHLGPDDAGESRGELWMPLWARPASFAEIRTLFSEGRIAIGRRPAHDGLDCQRAIHRLGAYRGIEAFQRYGLLKRSGMAYLAAPLQRVRVHARPQAAWIDELDRGGWLTRFQRFARGEKTARRFILLRKRLDDALFALAASTGDPSQVQSVLTLLAEVQFALGRSPRAAETVPPVPLLSARWATGADDGSAAYRIARALASIGTAGRGTLPMRAHLFPVLPRQGSASRHHLAVPVLGPLPDILIRILERRLLLQEQLDLEDDLLAAAAGVDLDDVEAFLRDEIMDRAMSTLLPALALCKEFGVIERPEPPRQGVPAAFGLLALTLAAPALLHKRAGLPDGAHLLPSRRVVAQLASNDPGRSRAAIQSVWRRLRGQGLTPIMPYSQCPVPVGMAPARLAAAALIPLDAAATTYLVRMLLNPPPLAEEAS